jgi:hypothetical protein
MPDMFRNSRLGLPLAVLGAAILVAVPVALGSGADIRPSCEEIGLAPNFNTSFAGEKVTYDVVVKEVGEANEPPTWDVTLTVLDGPNAGLTMTKATDTSGNVQFSYTSAVAGTDHLQATFFDLSEGDTAGSNTATQIWKQAAVGLAVPDRPVALVKPPGDVGFQGAQQVQDLPRGTVVDIGGNRAITVKNYLGDKTTFLGIPDRVPSRFLLKSGVRSRKGVIELALVGGRFGACSSTGAGSGSRALAAAGASPTKGKVKPVRRLWASGKGTYKATGKYASATVRGTFWQIADYCHGTFVYVRQGTVEVHDLVTGKTVQVKSGTSYFAKGP